MDDCYLRFFQCRRESATAIHVLCKMDGRGVGGGGGCVQRGTWSTLSADSRNSPKSRVFVLSAAVVSLVVCGNLHKKQTNLA